MQGSRDDLIRKVMASKKALSLTIISPNRISSLDPGIRQDSWIPAYRGDDGKEGMLPLKKYSFVYYFQNTTIKPPRWNVGVL